MANEKRVLSLHAHPDDTEFSCAGTLALLHEKGWEVCIATMTPGDCGSVEHNREKISRIRRTEAKNSAQLIAANYYCLECDDVFIMYDRPTLLKVIKLIREIRPTIVFAPSPSDYMLDHEMTSRLAHTACFSCGMPNIEIKGVQPFEVIPYLYYVDTLEGKNKFGKQIIPEMLADITNVIDLKERMLCCHESQRNWLMAHHGIDEYVILMKKFAEKRGRTINADYGEGFRQHLGHAFPRDNILKEALGKLIYEQ